MDAGELCGREVGGGGGFEQGEAAVADVDGRYRGVGHRLGDDAIVVCRFANDDADGDVMRDDDEVMVGGGRGEAGYEDGIDDAFAPIAEVFGLFAPEPGHEGADHRAAIFRGHGGIEDFGHLGPNFGFEGERAGDRLGGFAGAAEGRDDEAAGIEGGEGLRGGGGLFVAEGGEAGVEVLGAGES